MSPPDPLPSEPEQDPVASAATEGMTIAEMAGNLIGAVAERDPGRAAYLARAIGTLGVAGLDESNEDEITAPQDAHVAEKLRDKGRGTEFSLAVSREALELSRIKLSSLALRAISDWSDSSDETLEAYILKMPDYLGIDDDQLFALQSELTNKQRLLGNIRFIKKGQKKLSTAAKELLDLDADRYEAKQAMILQEEDSHGEYIVSDEVLEEIAATDDSKLTQDAITEEIEYSTAPQAFRGFLPDQILAVSAADIARRAIDIRQRVNEADS